MQVRPEHFAVRRRCFAPVPRASVKTATAANPGCLRSMCSPKRTSCRSDSSHAPRKSHPRAGPEERDKNAGLSERLVTAACHSLSQWSGWQLSVLYLWTRIAQTSSTACLGQFGASIENFQALPSPGIQPAFRLQGVCSISRRSGN